MRFVLRLIRDETGATAVEYGLIVTLIAVTVVAAVSLLGSNLLVKYNSISSNVAAVAS